MSEEQNPVQALVLRAQSGNLESFEQIYRDCQAGIYTFILSQVREPELAADLTQQTFLRAWESLHRLRQAGAFRGWLHRIAANLVRDEVKSGRARLEVRASELGDEGVLDRVVAADPGPEGAALQGELRREVWEALGMLPAEQRAAVVMHHLEHLPVTEIAAALGVRPGTVMSRLARAREALRERLRGYVEAEAHEMR
jgi:RNA polymerase sigma-70 factor (ECF subfamily)